MNIGYIWNRIIKILPGKAVINSTIPVTGRVHARSTVIDSGIGEYSYAGYGCMLLNCKVGKFSSIGDDVLIGLGQDHPLNWVSTSPAFYFGRDSIPKNLARKEFIPEKKITEIGNDVWIGAGALIKSGVKVGNGAVIGMGSIVTKDVPAYAIVAGTPARVIRYRFEESVRDRLEKTRWWDLPMERIAELAEYVDDIEMFISKTEECQ